MSSSYSVASQSERLAMESKNTPLMLIGIIGLLGVCGFGVYKYKTKGNMSTSVYLIQLKGLLQGVGVSALSVGLAYNIASEHLLKDTSKKE